MLQLIDFIYIILILSLSCTNQETCKCLCSEVCVAVINNSGQWIRIAKLQKHNISIVSRARIAKNEQACMAFNSQGENSFKLIVILNNGDTLVSKEVYSEGEYNFSDIVNVDTLKLEYKEMY
jgi:hypothetical protein